ncbi:MAG: DHH family phosphoesterase, partial [Candidatus Dojkabacteria bacterium]
MFRNLTNLIYNSRTILILNSKPDADSIGASLALQKMLRALGKTAHSCSAYPIPEYLRFLTNTGTIEVIDPKKYDFLP